MNTSISIKPKNRKSIECDRPWVEKNNFNVEDYEQHRGEVVLHGEAATTHRLRCGLDATFIRIVFCPVVAFWPGEGSYANRKNRETES